MTDITEPDDEELFPHQRSAFNWFRERNFTGILSIPTGAGKSRIFANIVESLPPQTSVVLVAVNDTQAEQYLSTLTEFDNLPQSIHLVREPEEWGSVFSSEGQLESDLAITTQPSARCIITTQWALRELPEAGRQWLDPDAIIVDSFEKMYSSPSFPFTIDECTHWMVGTALPEAWLRRKFDPDWLPLTGEYVFEVSIRSLIDDGVFSSYQYHPLVTQVPVTSTEVNRPEDKLSSDSSLDDPEVTEFANKVRQRIFEQTSDESLEQFDQLLQTGLNLPGIVIADTVSQATAIANRVETTTATGTNGEEYRSAIVTSETRDVERKSIFHEVSEEGVNSSANLLVVTPAIVPRANFLSLPTVVSAVGQKSISTATTTVSKVLSFDTANYERKLYDLIALPPVSNTNIDRLRTALEGPAIFTPGASNRYSAQRYLYNQLEKYGLGELVFTTPGF